MEGSMKVIRDSLSLWVKDYTNRKMTQVLKPVVVPYKKENKHSTLRK